jgi:hypothetical protein
MSENCLDRLWQIYTAINEWIRFADTKAGVALAFHAAAFAAGVPAIMAQRSYFFDRPYLVFVVVATCILAGISVCFGVKCIMPRLNVGEARSLIFFAHIAEAYPDPDSFAEHSLGHYQDAEAYQKQVLHQVWANARVAWSKHKDSAFCLWFMVAEFVVASAGFLFAFISN